MRRLYFIFSFVAIIIFVFACSLIEEVKVGGKIVGTIGCYEENNSEIMLKGYFIVTDSNDSLLCFNIEDSIIYVGYGCYGIDPIRLPFEFNFEYIRKNESDYVNFLLPLSDAMKQGIEVDKFKQAKIII